MKRCFHHKSIFKKQFVAFRVDSVFFHRFENNWMLGASQKVKKLSHEEAKNFYITKCCFPLTSIGCHKKSKSGFGNPFHKVAEKASAKMDCVYIADVSSVS